jgi:hypothetical protein
MTLDEKAVRLLCYQQAEKMWAAFTENEKAAVRFGMFPAAVMRAATNEGYDSRLLAVELMKAAERNGGMVA